MSDFDGLTVVISGPLVELARFQQLLQSLDGTLTLDRGQGADDGRVGVVRWSGSAAVARPFAVRGRKAKKVAA